MSNNRSLQIGDNAYETTLFTTTTSIRNFKRLIKVVGPSISVILEGQSELSLDDRGPLTKAISLLADNIDKEDVAALLKDLISTTTRNGQPINFDLDFMGKLGELFKVIVFVAKENYGGFFEAGDFGM